MTLILLLVASLAVVLGGAELFTNGVEWLGRRLRLSEGTVGSLLAAVGTALPETTIPVIAIILGRDPASYDIGIGAILGAPFMLATLAMFITGLAAIAWRTPSGPRAAMLIDSTVMRRDLGFFLAVYAVTLLSAVLPLGRLRLIVAAALVAAYAVYVVRTVRGGQPISGEQMGPLYLAPRSTAPALGFVALQVAIALGLIVGGARLFITAVEGVAEALNMPAFVLSLIIAPIATELPEKFNSLLWVRRGKDTLALGNITGAMVFQGSILPALGMAATPWRIGGLGLLSAGIALLAAGLIYGWLYARRSLPPAVLLVGGPLYVTFLAAALQSRGQGALGFLAVPVAIAVAVALAVVHGRRLAAARRAGRGGEESR